MGLEHIKGRGCFLFKYEGSDHLKSPLAVHNPRISQCQEATESAATCQFLNITCS